MEAHAFKKLGAIPYHRSGQELRVGRAAPALGPTGYDEPTFFQAPVLYQGKAPECGGFSLGFALEYLTNYMNKLSGSFDYAYEKTVDGVPNVEGTTIAAVGKAAQDVGSCAYPLCHDDAQDPAGTVHTLWRDVSPQAIKDGLIRAGWIPLFLNDLSWTGLQQAISQYKAVIVEAEVGDEWWTAPNGNTSWAASDVLPIRTPKQVVDGHFFVLGGKYDPQNIWFANSWSTQWGENGFGYFGPDYIPYIKNAIVLHKAQPSIQEVVNHPNLTQAEKNSVVQKIIDDMAEILQLVKKEIKVG